MKVLTKSLFLLSAVTALSAQAAEQSPKEDLALEGARWLAKSTGFVCAADPATLVEAPADLAALKVTFEQAVTDFSLDNALITATFSPEEGTTCRYSFLTVADNAAKTATFVQSRVFASEGEASCTEGGALLDAAFASNQYIWKERGHMLTIITPSTGAAAICGEGVDSIGVQFTLAGKIN